MKKRNLIVKRALHIVSSLLFLSTQILAQGTSTTDFEDAAKGNYTLSNILINGKSWELSGAMIGTDTAKDLKTGMKAARFRYVDSIPTSMTLLDEITDMTSISFQYARSNFAGDRSGTSAQFIVQLSNGSTWTSLDTIDLSGVDSLTTASYTSLPDGSSHLRFVAISGTLGKRFNIDNITIEYGGTASSSIVLDQKTPIGTGVVLSTNQLTAKYNAGIQKGSGSIHLYKAGGTLVESINVTATDVTISDSTATIAGITLENATSYYVLMDAGVFAKAGDAATTSTAVSEFSDWSFTTIDTSSLPYITTLDERFYDCDDAAIGIFKQYSVEGDRKWTCSTFGHGDASAAYMNGASGDSASNTNNDWLISAAKFDFAALLTPNLSFWNKKRFTGTVSLKVKISTNYTGAGDPTASTWTDIYTITAPAGLNEWSQVNAINLTAYKSTPFFLAFVYECGTTGAYEFSLDDINVANATSYIDFNSEYNSNLTVLGNPTNTQINLRFITEKAGVFTADIIDMNGRKVANQQFQINNGVNDIAIPNINLASGMYVIKISNPITGSSTFIKAIVQ